MVFDFSWMDNIADMGFKKEVLDEVMSAALAYGREGSLPEGMKPLTKMAMAFIAPQIDANMRKFDERCAQLDRARQARKKAGTAGQGRDGSESEEESCGEGCEDDGNNPSGVDTSLDEVGADSSDVDTDSSDGGTTLVEIESRLNKTASASSNVVTDSSDNGTMSRNTVTTSSNVDTTSSNVDTDSSSIATRVSNEYEYENRYIDVVDEDAREFLKNLFFERPITLLEYLRRWETTEEELRLTCDEVLDDWIIAPPPRRTMADTRQHFINAVRKKYEIKKTRENEKTSKGRGPSPRGRAGHAPVEGGYGLVD